MNSLSSTKQKILDYLKANPQTSVVTLLDSFHISKQAMHKHLKELQEIQVIYKVGTPPKVFYSVVEHEATTTHKSYSDEVQVLVKDFVLITPSGHKQVGIDAFETWCTQRMHDTLTYAYIYHNTKEKYNRYQTNGLIDATHKMNSTFRSECMVDTCLYGSFSAMEIFGKTGLYTQMLYAKQSGNKENMRDFFPVVADHIHQIIKHYHIEAVGFISPTVNRSTQLLKELEKYLNLSLPKVSITKIKNQYLVPQKTLSKPFERKQNADETFVVETIPPVEYILLIDDFVGSGSSFNSIAKKIKFKHNCTIICYAMCGTPNGVINGENSKFEVIHEA